MIFVIEYDRRKGEIETIREFEQSDRSAADVFRQELELKSASEPNREIVTLEAASEEALRVTHRRYFTNDLRELTSAA